MYLHFYAFNLAIDLCFFNQDKITFLHSLLLLVNVRSLNKLPGYQINSHFDSLSFTLTLIRIFMLLLLIQTFQCLFKLNYTKRLKKIEHVYHFEHEI